MEDIPDAPWINCYDEYFNLAYNCTDDPEIEEPPEYGSTQTADAEDYNGGIISHD